MKNAERMKEMRGLYPNNEEGETVDQPRPRVWICDRLAEAGKGGKRKYPPPAAGAGGGGGGWTKEPPGRLRRPLSLLSGYFLKEIFTIMAPIFANDGSTDAICIVGEQKFFGYPQT